MAGTVVLTTQRTEGVVKRAVFTATADASDGTFPAPTLLSRGVFIDGAILAIKTNPGATAPTDNYDVTLVDADGLDRLNGVGLNRDTTTSEIAAITGAPYAGPDEVLTLTLAGNSVNSAIVVITIYWTSDIAAAAGTLGALSASSAVIGLVGHDQTGVADGRTVTPSTVTLATSAEADDIIDTGSAHGYSAGDEVRFPTLTGGSGLVAGTHYFVIAANLAAQTFQVSATLGGSAVNFTTDITAGTVVKVRTALAASTAAKTVILTAETDNTGVIAVGGAATVIAALATRRGVPLAAGDSLSLAIDNLADVGIDSTVSGDGVTYVYTS